MSDMTPDSEKTFHIFWTLALNCPSSVLRLWT
jgi:hypothetical protein